MDTLLLQTRARHLFQDQQWNDLIALLCSQERSYRSDTLYGKPGETHARVSNSHYAAYSGSAWVVFTVGILGELTLNTCGSECTSVNWTVCSQFERHVYKWDVSQLVADNIVLLNQVNNNAD